jgi:AraC-like DNA-binding protein
LRHLREAAIELSVVSYRLGFSEPSALYRAVKRWFGTTATDYRETALAS